MVAPLSDKLSRDDLDFLASGTIPTLKHAPGTQLRSKSPPPLPPSRFSRRTRKEKALERAPVVSRRLRRYVNDRALYVAAADSDALPTTRGELRSLFEHHAHTVFSTLCEDKEAASAWAPYVEQNLDQLDRNVDTHDSNGHEMETTRNKKDDGLNKVDRKIRYILKSRASLVKPLIQQVEDTVITLQQGESIVLRLPHALSRMVAHGVAQFHSLAHKSCGDGADRVLVIRRETHTVQGSARLIDELE